MILTIFFYIGRKVWKPLLQFWFYLVLCLWYIYITHLILDILLNVFNFSNIFIHSDVVVNSKVPRLFFAECIGDTFRYLMREEKERFRDGL